MPKSESSITIALTFVEGVSPYIPQYILFAIYTQPATETVWPIALRDVIAPGNKLTFC